MSNPLYEQLKSGYPNNNFMSMLGRYKEFKKNFRGNPYTIVQQMLNDGRMSQSQFTQLKSMAEQFQSFMNEFKP